MPINVTPHGIATIQQPVIYPTSVEANTPFEIQYTIHNSGNVTDLLYGHLLVSGVELTGSHWEQSVAVNGAVTKTFTHPGINTATTFLLETGRV